MARRGSSMAPLLMMSTARPSARSSAASMSSRSWRYFPRTLRARWSFPFASHLYQVDCFTPAWAAATSGRFPASMLSSTD